MFEPLGETTVRQLAKAGYDAFSRSASSPSWIELPSTEQAKWMLAIQASIEMLDGDDITFLAGPLGLTTGDDWICAECGMQADDPAPKLTEPAPPPKDG